MENLYSLLIIFSGATITVLGSFLFASDRQLTNKRREFDELKRKQAAKPVEPAEAHSSKELMAKNEELLKEISSLSRRLEESEKTLSECQNEQRRLLSVQSENQQLQEKIDNLRNQLQTSETQVSESTARMQEAVLLSASLQTEIAAWKEQMAERRETIETLQGAEQLAAKAQSEKQELWVENQQLQKEIVKLHDRLQANEVRLNASATQHKELAERHARLQTDFAESKQQSDILTAKNKELRDEVDALSSEVAASGKSAEDLRTIVHDARLENQRQLAVNQQLQSEIADLHERLVTAQSQLGEFLKRTQEAADCNEKLQIENGELKLQLEQNQAAIKQHENAARRFAEIQSEDRKLRLEKQGVEEEVENLRVQLNTSKARFEDLVRRNQEASDRCVALETEVADLKQQLENSQSEAREKETAQRQQLAEVESREMIYREQQQALEALIVDLEHELFEEKNRVQGLEDTRRRLQETERVCEELGDENRRLGEEIARWRERLAASEESQGEVSTLRQQLDELATDHARLGGEKLQAQREIVAADEPMPSELAIAETKLLSNGSNEPVGDQSHPNSADSAAEIHVANEEESSQIVQSSAKRKLPFGAVPAIVVIVIAGAVAMRLATSFSTSKKSAIATETSSHEYAAEAVSKPRIQPAQRLQGTFETVRPTQVYSGPNKNSALIANIGRGMKLNVVDSRDGWLEIRSRHGRPTGFIRQEAAARIRQN